MGEPSSVIWICSVPALDNRYEHTLWFENEDAQQSYFVAHQVKFYSKYTFLRRNNTIKVEARMHETTGWHYLMLYNGEAERKYYYYFINKVNYVNDCTVELEIELDVIQSYMFSWSLGECFIERTHTLSDQPGEHTIEEGLETGPLIDSYVTEYAFTDLCILVLTAVDSSINSAYANVYGQSFSGLRISAVNRDDYAKFGTYLSTLDSAGKIDAIVSMWMYPKELVKINGSWTSDSLFKTVIDVEFNKNVNIDSTRVKAYSFDGYVPKNRKLECYPYTMLYVTNHMGGSAVYRPERFNNPETASYTFNLYGALSPESGVLCVPKDYNGQTLAYDEGLTLGAFPSCAWDSDPYKVWLAQNQNTQELALKTNVIKAGAGALMAAASIPTGNIVQAGGGLAMGVSALQSTQQIMAQRADMDIQPPQARGTHSANTNLSHGHHGFAFHYKTITKEYARAIDDYFNRYGYKVNRVTVPTLKNRDNFTYIKTVGCTVAGNVPSEDRVRIGNIFDKGITFWANHDVVGHYSDNPI